MREKMAKPRKKKPQAKFARPPRNETMRDADGLTPKQAKFVKQYLIDTNGTRAAMVAGYCKTKGSAAAHASYLLKNIKINKAINRGLAEQTKRIEKRMEIGEVTKERWLRELALLGFAEMNDFAKVTERGVRLITTDQLKPGFSGAIKSLKQSESMSGGSQSLELHPKLPALQMLADHFGWTKQRVEHSGDPEGAPIKFQGMSDEQLRNRIQELAGLVSPKKPESPNEA